MRDFVFSADSPEAHDRHKRNQKMQWSRQGAHNVLQIRSSMASNTWNFEWRDALFDAIRVLGKIVRKSLRSVDNFSTYCDVSGLFLR